MRESAENPSQAPIQAEKPAHVSARHQVRTIFLTETAKHSLQCHSVSCLLSDVKHCQVVVLQTKSQEIVGEDLTSVCSYWAANGKKPIDDIAVIG